MKLHVFLPAFALAASTVFSGWSISTQAVSIDSRTEVNLRVLRPSGAVTEVRFEVVADSASEARTVAIEALKAIAPGSSVIESADTGVSAQWQPWPWTWTPAELPVRVAYNPTDAPPGVGPSTIIAGLDDWSRVPTSSFRYQYAGVTNNTASIVDFGPDGENVISWATLDCSKGCVLGVTSKEGAHEVDMLLNNNPAAAQQLGVGTTVDWRTVILHELGHMAGLEHSCPVPFGPCTLAEADAVMFYQYRGIQRKLGTDDTAAISSLYPSGSGPTPTAPPAASPTPSPFPEFPVFVSSGWNLLVLPPVNIEGLTDGLPCLRAVYRFSADGWSSWIRGAPDVIQEVTSVDSESAYWLLADRACGRTFP
ncbi:MAG: matrixin family metalloprotease [bacterium]